MQHMQLMYCHACTSTIRIEGLTPPSHRLHDLVAIYLEDTGEVQEVDIIMLVPNANPYRRRGWCVAELQWSLLRGATAKSTRIDECKEDEVEVLEIAGQIYVLDCAAPMPPAVFRDCVKAGGLCFTHRSDQDTVFSLQEEVFLAKAASCAALLLERLPKSEVGILAVALPFHHRLTALSLKACQLVWDLEGQEDVDWWKRKKVLCKEATQLFEALQEMESITEVSFTWCNGGDALAQAVAGLLKINKSIRLINLEQNLITDNGAKFLVEALQSDSLVGRLDLSCNEIGKEGAQVLRSLCGLAINLSGNLGVEADASAEGTCDASGSPGADPEADVESTSEAGPLGKLGGKVVAELLKSECAIRNLELDGKGIDDVGALALCHVLTANTALQTLSLRRNIVGVAGGEAFGRALASNATLHKLDLYANGLGDAGAEGLAWGLHLNSTLQSLTVGGNDIGDCGAKALASALQSH